MPIGYSIMFLTVKIPLDQQTVPWLGGTPSGVKYLIGGSPSVATFANWHEHCKDSGSCAHRAVRRHTGSQGHGDFKPWQLPKLSSVDSGLLPPQLDF